MKTPYDVFIVAGEARTGFVNTCAHNETLPSPKRCPYPGLWLEVLLTILELAKKRPVKLVVKLADTFGFDGRNETSNSPFRNFGNMHTMHCIVRTSSQQNIDIVFRTSMGLVRSGIADITYPFASMYPARMDLPKFGPLFEKSYVYVYKNFPSSPGLETFDLATKFLGPWTGFLLLSLTWFVTKQLLNRAQSQSSEPLPFSIQQFSKRFRKMILFWKGIMLGIVSGFIVIIFVKDPKPQQPIKTIEDLARESSHGNYRAIFQFPLGVKIYYSLPSFKKSEKFNPPLLMYGASLETINEKIQSDTITTRPKNVAVLTETLYPEFQSKFCGLEFFIDQKLVNQHATAYFRHGLGPLKLSVGEIKVVRETIKRLMDKYYPRKVCPDSGTGHENALLPTIAIRSISGVFVLYLMLLGGSLAALLTEYSWSYITRSKSYRIK